MPNIWYIGCHSPPSATKYVTWESRRDTWFLACRIYDSRHLIDSDIWPALLILLMPMQQLYDWNNNCDIHLPNASCRWNIKPEALFRRTQGFCSIASSHSRQGCTGNTPLWAFILLFYLGIYPSWSGVRADIIVLLTFVTVNAYIMLHTVGESPLSI